MAKWEETLREWESKRRENLEEELVFLEEAREKLTQRVKEIREQLATPDLMVIQSLKVGTRIKVARGERLGSTGIITKMNKRTIRVMLDDRNEEALFEHRYLVPAEE